MGPPDSPFEGNFYKFRMFIHAIRIDGGVTSLKIKTTLSVIHVIALFLHILKAVGRTILETLD